MDKPKPNKEPKPKPEKKGFLLDDSHLGKSIFGNIKPDK